MIDFSFCLMPRKPTKELVAMAQRAEKAEIPLIWIPDETFMRDPWVLLGGIASATSKIRLGIGIVNPYTRHPMQVARAVATLSDLCQDRVVLGIGAGLKSTRNALGTPDGDFVDVTRDAIKTMKALFAGETVTIENDVFRLDAAHMEFVPPFPVDIYVATTHPRAFRMAGEVADGVIVGNVGTPETMRDVVGWIAEGSRQVGRNSAELTVVAWNFVLCGHDSDVMHETLRMIVARTIANSHGEITSRLGVERDRVEAIRAAVRRSNPEITSKLVPNEIIDNFAIVGSAEQCVARLRDLHAAGAHVIGVRPSLEVVEQLDYERMVHELWSALRAG